MNGKSIYCCCGLHVRENSKDQGCARTVRVRKLVDHTAMRSSSSDLALVGIYAVTVVPSSSSLEHALMVGDGPPLDLEAEGAAPRDRRFRALTYPDI